MVACLLPVVLLNAAYTQGNTEFQALAQLVLSPGLVPTGVGSEFTFPLFVSLSFCVPLHYKGWGLTLALCLTLPTQLAGLAVQLAYQGVLVIQINIKKSLFCPSVICDLGLSVSLTLTDHFTITMNGLRVLCVGHRCPQLRLRCQGLSPNLWTLLKIP